MDITDTQLELERLFDKNRIIPRIKEDFSSLSRLIEDASTQSSVAKDFIMDFLVQCYLRKQAVPSMIVGALIKYGNAQLVANQIQELIELDLADYDGNRIICKWFVDTRVEAEIEKYQYPMPMVVEPEELICNSDTGYLTDFKTGILLNKSLHDGDVCLDHLNKMNRVELCINFDTARNTVSKWNNLRAPKTGESQEDFIKRVESHKKFAVKCKWTHDLLEKVNEGKFYLTHAYDKRGRTFSKGYLVNYQGHDYNKAVVEFANKERIL